MVIPIETTITPRQRIAESYNWSIKRAACDRNDGLQTKKVFLWRQIMLKNRVANERLES